MDRQQIPVALLKISLAAVCASTWIFVSFIFETRPEEVVVEPEINPLTTLVRLPASLPTQLPAQLPKILGAGPRALDPIRMDVLKMDCWDRTEPKERAVTARWVRLTGKACQGDPAAESIRVLNQSNGYEGTVFSGETKQLTTDFIPLQSGANNIIVRISQADGVVFENQIVLVKEADE